MSEHKKPLIIEVLNSQIACPKFVHRFRTRPGIESDDDEYSREKTTNARRSRCLPRRARHPGPDAELRACGTAPRSDPTHPDEDYADKWSKDPRLELSFLQWHSHAVRDFATLPALMNPVALRAATKRSFQVDLRDDHLRSLGLASALAIIVAPSAPRVQISSPSRPWGSGD